MKFNQSTYNVDEDDGPAQPVLVLSNPSSTDITISVFSTDGSATGKDNIINTYSEIATKISKIVHYLQTSLMTYIFSYSAITYFTSCDDDLHGYVCTENQLFLSLNS